MSAARFNPPVPLKVDQLLLDNLNPRIPPDRRALEQDDLVAYVADRYFALAIARSISAHAFFPSEPLIAIPTVKPAGKYIVVEGNRRLAALKLLLHPTLRDKLADRTEWDRLPTDSVPDTVPVVVVKTRRDVAPVIGYRHISGIQPWDAHAKARYIADQIDNGVTFEEAAQEVGETEAEVRTNYRNFRISEQAHKLRINQDTLDNLENGFGVFNRAMQTSNIRDFVGAPPADKVRRGADPIPASKHKALKEVVGFMYGPDAVLSDSRDLTKLGKVLASEVGLQVLREEGNLEEALIAAGGIRERLINRLGNAERNLRASKEDFLTYSKDSDVRGLLGEIVEAVSELENIK